MLQIQKTQDYSLFKTIEGNRKVDKSHVKKMIAVIEKDNQLAVHPIIVNKDFSVIDGQHRLEAAKTLGVEIYYVKSDTISDFHVIDGNVNQKIFEVDDFIHYFSTKDKNPVYIKIVSMLKATGLKPKALLTLILGVVSASILEVLKTGKFKFSDREDPNHILDFYKDFTAYAKDKRLKPISMFTNHNFTRALRWMFNTTGFDPKVFFKKLDLRWFDLKPQRTSEDWYNLLINIYNYKNHNRLEADEN